MKKVISFKELAELFYQWSLIDPENKEIIYNVDEIYEEFL